MNFYVYILKSLKTFEYYKGLTKDVDNRIDQHLNGKVKYTKNKCPLILIHVEICKSRKEARKVEKFFKSGWGREIINELGEVNAGMVE